MELIPVKNRDTQALGFFELGTGLFAGNDVMCFAADAATDPASKCFNRGRRLIAGH